MPLFQRSLCPLDRLRAFQRSDSLGLDLRLARLKRIAIGVDFSKFGFERIAISAELRKGRGHCLALVEEGVAFLCRGLQLLLQRGDRGRCIIPCLRGAGDSRFQVYRVPFKFLALAARLGNGCFQRLFLRQQRFPLTLARALALLDLRLSAFDALDIAGQRGRALFQFDLGLAQLIQFGLCSSGFPFGLDLLGRDLVPLRMQFRQLGVALVIILGDGPHGVTRCRKLGMDRIKRRASGRILAMFGKAAQDFIGGFNPLRRIVQRPQRFTVNTVMAQIGRQEAGQFAAQLFGISWPEQA